MKRSLRCSSSMCPSGTISSSRLEFIFILSFQYIAVFVQRARIGPRCTHRKVFSQGVLIAVKNHIIAQLRFADEILIYECMRMIQIIRIRMIRIISTICILVSCERANASKRTDHPNVGIQDKRGIQKSPLISW